MENKRYHQHPLLFSFEPGDGTLYWVLFGQQQEMWGAYTILVLANTIRRSLFFHFRAYLA